ncbi:TonB-dependent receptor [Bacteroidia bacterium]|nr:TonB-dependent receptor [Bacteroidia bacterium]
MNIRVLSTLFLTLLAFSGFAQNAKISGIVTDSDGVPIELAIVRSSSGSGAATDEKGKYTLSVTSGDSCTLVFSCIGYNKTQRVIPEVTGDMTINVKMRTTSIELGEVTVTGTKRAQTNAMQRINTEQGRLAVDATGGSIESFIVTAGTGVSSTNELSTQYSVRGGNYNENIVYVNGIEVYRPLLIRSGQQEGMSFINPDLTDRVEFSSGGFDARYGDKMSSVLDVTYKKPEKLGGGVTGSMLGGNIYLGSNSGKFSQISGLRYKRGTTLLKTLDTKGDYNPSVMDFQTYMNYAFTKSLNLSVLGNFSDNTYDFNPETRKTSYGTMGDVKNFEVYYDGSSERDRFRTAFGAATLKYNVSETADVALQMSAFQSSEQENYDIDGEYWLSNIMSDDKEITGTGSFHEHARNYLKANVANIALTGNAGINHNTIRWSVSYQKEQIKDRLREWELRDSMGYSLPYYEDELRVYSNLFSRNDIQSNRFSGYLQDTYKYRIDAGLFSLTAGIRGSYWDFNKEFIFSPRASLGFIPSRNQNLTLRIASGVYYQAPFYKEFRTTHKNEDGSQYITLNNDIKSQRSIHFVMGGDYDFRFDERPFKFTTELYYKKLSDLIPYTVNNVRIQYYGSNVSNGHATGVDMKLFGQFVPGTDSWLGFSLMEAKQNIGGQKVPMPTDQLYNITFHYTDYMPKYERIQFNLRMIFADGIPFSVPGREYLNSIRTLRYWRVDAGLTYRILGGEDDISNSSFWKNFKNIWLGMDLFNLFDIGNVSSYSWFSDVNSVQHAVPDRLTGRQINFKLIAEF